MPPKASRQISAAPQKNNNPSPAVAPVVGAAEQAVNKKKAKRRAKEAAKRAVVEGSSSGIRSPSPSDSAQLQNGTKLHVPGAFEQSSLDPQGYAADELGYLDDANGTGPDDDELYYNNGEGARYLHDLPATSSSRTVRKKRGKFGNIRMIETSQKTYYMPSSNSHNAFAQQPSPPPPPPLSTKQMHKFPKDRIWNTSTQEERENIKEFWLSLEEPERRSLVKVEKEAVLKKMKEQQKHSCSCSVCGRKRTAIEEELEVLYDAYYEELEQYAHHQVVLEDGTVLTGPEAAARMYSPMPRIPPGARLPPLIGRNGPQSRFQEEPLDDDDELADEAEAYDDEQDGYGDEYEKPPPQAMDFFNFGNSLTVQGGILTVADDLLKNDGKKFIEMMEQLAERRMQREEEAQFAAQGLRHPSLQHTYSAPLEEDDGYDDEDYTDDDEYDEEDEEETEGLTEEQRMEEGRRMFQIFAARMFEQRVLTAYREKVARERQEKLMEELADEEGRDAAKEEKKARDAAKKREKKRAQRVAKEEEKARKDAEKKAAEDALRVEEELKLEQQRQKRDEQKRKREEEKRKQEEEKRKKEEDRKRRQAEARRQQEEAERKQREQKEKERLKREEVKKKEREDREAKGKEARDRKEREAAERQDRESKARAEKISKEPAKKAEPPKGPSQPTPVPLPPLLRKQTSNVAVPGAASLQTSASASPHLHIATPVIPKTTSPSRQRQASQQSSVHDSHQSSPKSTQVPSGSSATSPSTTHQIQVSMPKQSAPSQPQQHNQPTGPAIGPPPGMTYPPNAAPGMPINGFAGQAHHARYPPGYESYGNHNFGIPYRGFAPNGISYPPGSNGVRPIGSGPPGFTPVNATNPHPPVGMFNSAAQAPVGQRTQPHSRQPSASLAKAVNDAALSSTAQPIAPPAPIKRPSLSDDKPESSGDDMNKQLGSSALLDDEDAPVSANPPQVGPFGSAPLFQQPFHSGHRAPFTPSSMPPFGTSPSMQPWAAAGPHSAGFGPTPPMFSPFTPTSRHPSRPVVLRQYICDALKLLNSSPYTKQANGFYSIEAVAQEVRYMKNNNEPPIQIRDLLDVSDIEGNAQNGGGTLVVKDQGHGGVWIKYEDNSPNAAPGGRSNVGDIGSPITGHAQPFGGFSSGAGGQRGFDQAPGSGVPGF